MASEFSKFFVAFLIGSSVSSFIFLKIQYDQSQAFNLLFSIESVTEHEIVRIWDESTIDEDNMLSEETLVQLFIKIYQLQERKLVALRSRFNIQNASFLLDLYQNVGLLRHDVANDTHTHLVLPQALRRCRNILKMLNENSYEMVKMLIPNLSQNISKLDFAKLIPAYVHESLRNDLCVFLDAQQRGYDPIEYLSFADRVAENDLKVSGQDNGFQPTSSGGDFGSDTHFLNSAQSSSYQYPSNYYSPEAGEEDGLLTGQNVDPNINSAPATSSHSYHQYKSFEDDKVPRRKASRQSDVFDYLHKTANL